MASSQPAPANRLLEAGLAAFEEGNIAEIKKAGSALAEEALMQSRPLLVDAAAAFYSLAKFLEKPYIRFSPRWKQFAAGTRKNLKQAIDSSKEGNEEKVAACLQKLLSDCEEVSELLGRFHVSAVEKARVKIATDFYAHGASLGAAVQLAGADKASVLSYVGVTRLSEKYYTLPLKQRLKAAEELFCP